MKKMPGIILLLAFFCANSAQSQITSNEVWMGIDAKIKLNKKFRLDIEEQFRHSELTSDFYTSFTEFGLKYEVAKRFDVKLNLRHSIEKYSNNRNRISLDLNNDLSPKDSKIRIDNRIRLQNTKTVNGNGKAYIREKIKFGYNLSKLVDPYMGGELYFRFNQKNELRRYRVTVGLDWKITKRWEASTFYRFQKEMNVKKPDAQNIVGLSFSYNTSVKKIKKLLPSEAED